MATTQKASAKQPVKVSPKKQMDSWSYFCGYIFKNAVDSHKGAK